MDKDKYILGGIITGGISFIAIWLYAIGAWGLLWGLMAGWLPALIGATVLGLIWPLPVAIVVYLLVLAIR